MILQYTLIKKNASLFMFGFSCSRSVRISRVMFVSNFGDMCQVGCTPAMPVTYGFCRRNRRQCWLYARGALIGRSSAVCSGAEFFPSDPPLFFRLFSFCSPNDASSCSGGSVAVFRRSSSVIEAFFTDSTVCSTRYNMLWSR